jgi:hypothetical protein
MCPFLVTGTVSFFAKGRVRLIEEGTVPLLVKSTVPFLMEGQHPIALGMPFRAWILTLWRASRGVMGRP